MKLKKLLSAVLAFIIVLGIGLNARAESQNDQLALYYATLSQMGGNEVCSAEQAQEFAKYYADLAAKERAAGGVAPITPETSTVKGATLRVENVSASDDFYNRVEALVNNLPAPVKARLSKYDIVFKTYNNGGGFGYSDASGLTRCVRTISGRKRSVEFTVMLSQTSSDINFTLYHETGHVLGNIFWKETGIRGSESKEFLESTLNEISALNSLNYEINATPGLEENFADSFADFYLHNANMAAACPKIYNYWCNHAPQ